MQLLIVHHDAELGEQLVEIVREYTEHHCGFATSSAEALEWARGVTRCSVLLTQLDGEGVNGLSLAASLCDVFAGLQTMFLPAYAAAEERLELPRPKVFAEPIDGQRLLDAIAFAEAQRQTGMDLHHPLEVIQMCCLSGRGGALQFVAGSATTQVFMQSGHIVHVESGAASGMEALSILSTWEAAEFAYDYAVAAPQRTITAPWDEAVLGAVARRKAETAERGAAPAHESAALEIAPAVAAPKRGVLSSARIFRLLSVGALLSFLRC